MSSSIDSVYDLPDVSFIDNDTIDAMMQRMVANYEKKYAEVTGEEISLAAASKERIRLYAAALELFQIEECVDMTGKMDLLKYSYGDFLDHIGARRGVYRQQPTAAETTLRFTLSAAQTYAIGIPAGTRVTNGNGIYFKTEEYGEVTAGETYADIGAICTQTGVAGNDILAGQISTIVDPLPYVESVANTTTTEGGAALEDDKSFVERIFLAPSGYSVAGPEDAYIYWAKTYNSNIGSVKPITPSACSVTLYVLLKDGTFPSEEIISGLTEFMQQRPIRPMTDNLTVSAPTAKSFDVALTYYINKSDTSKAAQIQTAVAAAIDDYITWQTSELGLDINPAELVKRIQNAGAKRPVITAPVYTAVEETEAAVLGTKSVTYGGIEDD